MPVGVLEYGDKHALDQRLLARDSDAALGALEGGRDPALGCERSAGGGCGAETGDRVARRVPRVELGTGGGDQRVERAAHLLGAVADLLERTPTVGVLGCVL